MSIAEITDKVNELGRAWEQFKTVNDQRLKEIEKRGAADPLHMEQLTRINQVLDQHKQRVDQLEIAQSRPLFGVETKQGVGDGHVSEYRKAFCNYLRKGMDAGLEQLQLKALSVGSDADGGYLVTSTMASHIAKLVQNNSPVRAVARVENISSDSLDIIEDYDEAAAGWTTETATPADSDTPQVNKRNIPVFELYAQPKATQKLIDDAAIDIENWIGEKVAEIFARKENTAFISGNGTSQPKGILTYANGTAAGQIEQVLSGTAGQVTATGLLNLFYALKDGYVSRAHFMMNRSTVQAVRLLKDSTSGQYLWNPSLLSGKADTLLGVPVAEVADMPVAGAGALAIALGDFYAGYLIVDRIGIRTLRDPYTDKPFVKFYTTKRVGGSVVNFEAIKLLKLAAS